MKAKQIAESGILIALTIVVLYAASILPVSRLTVLTIASCFIPIAIIRTSLKNTLLIYIASSILSLFLIPINTALSYVLFFGIYGIIKYYIEKVRIKDLRTRKMSFVSLPRLRTLTVRWTSSVGGKHGRFSEVSFTNSYYGKFVEVMVQFQSKLLFATP